MPRPQALRLSVAGGSSSPIDGEDTQTRRRSPAALARTRHEAPLSMNARELISSLPASGKSIGTSQRTRMKSIPPLRLSLRCPLAQARSLRACRFRRPMFRACEGQRELVDTKSKLN